MDAVGLLLAYGVVVLVGTLAGAITGLSPGLHVNNVAVLVVSTQGVWAAFVSTLVPDAASDPDTVAVLLASLLVGTAASHAVFDFIPSVFFGAPSEETALSILPGHRMLLDGRGAFAVALATRGALLGAAMSVLLLIPLRILLSDPVFLYDAFRPNARIFLALLLVALAASEARHTDRRIARIGSAVVVQGLSGLLGIAVLRGPSGLASDSALFPLFTGLFGMPSLIASAVAPPGAWSPQRIERLPRLARRETSVVARGVLAGAAVSWLPGLSGGAAATLATLGSRRTRPEAFLVLLGATATSTAMLSVAMLFVIGRARSGVAAAVDVLLGPSARWPLWGEVPQSMLLPFVAGILACAVAAPLAVRLADGLARRWSAIDPRALSRAAVIALIALIVLLTGLGGLVVAAVGSLVGFLPVRAGVRRVHMMAALLVPALLSV